MGKLIISRKDALRLGLKRYFTGKPCKHGHVCERQALKRSCLECHRLLMKSISPERKREAVRRHRAKNTDAYKLKYWGNPAEQERCRTKWKLEPKEACNARKKRWRDRNPEEARARGAATEKRRRRQTPPWADRQTILAIYKECRRITKETGIPHHVDHYMPLKGETVSGLHVEQNLRIIPAVENMKKRNKIPPVMRAFAA